MRRLFKYSVVAITGLSVLAGPALTVALETTKAPTPVAEKKTAEAAVSLKVSGMT